MNTLRRTLTNRRTAAWVTGTYAAFLSYLLLTPEPLFLLGDVGGDVHQAVDATFSTYLQHATSYAILTGLSVWLAQTWGRRSLILFALPACGHALLTESLQRFIPQRYGELLDVLADLAGIAAALVVCAVAPTMFRLVSRLSLVTDPARHNA